MAPGFRSLAGFPLGAGKTFALPAATVGFISPLWWMAGLDGGFIPPVVLPDADGVFMGRKKKRKGLASPPPMLVPALPNDDDEVLERVLDLFMKGA